MPQVDFTLEDIRKVMRHDMHEMMDQRFAEERVYTEALLAKALATEREHTRAMIQDSRDEIIAQFMSFVEDNFTPAVDSLQEQIHELKRARWGFGWR